MKIYLFGGAEVKRGQVGPELKLIEAVIRESGVKQVLHIPFARIRATEVEWDGDWYHKYISLPDVEYLNANNAGDILRAQSPLVFLSGGSDATNLIKKIKADDKISQLITTATFIIGESAGAKILGKFFRTQNDILPGLNIVKNAMIEGHYTERQRRVQLLADLRQTDCRYGVGIDALTGMEFDLKDFPNKYNRIGNGSIEIIA